MIKNLVFTHARIISPMPDRPNKRTGDHCVTPPYPSKTQAIEMSMIPDIANNLLDIFLCSIVLWFLVNKYTHPGGTHTGGHMHTYRGPRGEAPHWSNLDQPPIRIWVTILIEFLLDNGLIHPRQYYLHRLRWVYTRPVYPFRNSFRCT